LWVWDGGDELDGIAISPQMLGEEHLQALLESKGVEDITAEDLFAADGWVEVEWNDDDVRYRNDEHGNSYAPSDLSYLPDHYQPVMLSCKSLTTRPVSARKEKQMAKKGKNFTLSESSLGLLARLDNASGYLDRIVSNNWTRAQFALENLKSTGWKPNEILAACDVLNGCWLHVADPKWHAASLEDGSVFSDKWEIDNDRWREMVIQVSENGGLAFSLDLVVSEFWAGNTWLESAIRKEPAD
jgi:hypothetical protein